LKKPSIYFSTLGKNLAVCGDPEKDLILGEV